MAKKILLLIFLCILLVTTVALNEFFMNLQNVNTFKTYVLSDLKIPLMTVHDYFSNDIQVNREAKEEIILTTLENMEYQHWKDYLDYIELKIFNADVMPDTGKELIIALNFSKDLAAISIYSPMEEEYIYKKSIKDILPIQDMTFIKIPEKNHNFLVTEQLLDERLGAFFVDHFIEIYFYDNNSFESVFRKSKHLQEIYNLHWIDPEAPTNKWIKIVEQNDIVIEEDANVTIKVSIHKEKSEATKDELPRSSDYKELEELITEERYYWSPKYSHFILFEGRNSISSQPVAILNDTSLWSESLLGFKSNNYEIKTLENKKLIINKSFIVP